MTAAVQPMTYAEARALTDQIKEGLRYRTPRSRYGITRSDKRPHVVYRAYDVYGDLLYVGISLDFRARANAHRTSQWWSQVTRIDIEHMPDRDSALAREARLIALFLPTYNRCGGQP